MSTCQRLASFAFAIVLPALQAEPHCPGNIASLRLRLVQRSQIIIVPVTINHSGPYDFLVDTGTQVTSVDPALAGELHLKIEGTTELLASVSARVLRLRIWIFSKLAHTL